MPNEELEGRREKILEGIIRLYITTAVPVGSQIVARQFRPGLSPATIRNEMANLAELGYIRKPHTSAGRVPTDKGYRYYVDYLMEAKRLTQAQKERIAREYWRLPYEIDEIMAKTSKLLSSITRQAAMVLIPRLKKSAFKRLELIPMSQGKVLTVWMTTSGLIKNRVLNLGQAIPESVLHRICNLLNSELEGFAIDEIREHLLRRLKKEKGSLFYLIKRALDIVSIDGLNNEEAKLYLEGRDYILDQPEFKDLDKVRLVMRALEEKRELLEVLDEDLKGEGVKVHIGRENRFEDMWECSLVTSTYWIGEEAFGTLGILGPKRMEYSEMVVIVDHMAKVVGEVLSRR